MNAIYTNHEPNALTGLVTNGDENFQSARGNRMPKLSFNVLQRLRQWLDQIQVNDPEMARVMARLIPAQCPFERDIMIFGCKLGHIPPLCKLNPFYEQLVGLRFRALCFLADQCGEDIQPYC
ncbi:Mo-dependent nitrogenase C-terminal domain-containing protein [Allocoleopsis sp.]|uniref:Mo-dependent nitrogenase C-terminal domain-containing protein n=1 Tax=Allocoleopsis sp. TaxID=3088169 RepID=UPI002FD1C834